MRNIYVVRTSMKRDSDTIFQHFAVDGVYTSMKRARKAIMEGYAINKGTSLSEYAYGNTIQIEYNLYSTDSIPCNHRSLINAHPLNKEYC